MKDSTRMATYDGTTGPISARNLRGKKRMSDLPLNETALQAAEKVAGEHAFSTNSYNRLLISTYLREAKFKLEKDGPAFRPYDQQRQVGPWEQIPVVQAESEEE